jgi:HTH-type transcriptional regulator, sugar sensing transcriptional regulator
MQIIESLQSLGLNEKEARVYTALLALGRASAYSVAEKAGLKKPTTYVILGDLIQKGLVLKVPRVRKQLFIAKAPDEFFALVEERLSVAKKALPELMAMALGKTPKVRSFFYEGLNGVRQALWYHLDEMKDKTFVGFYASPHEAAEGFEKLSVDWNNELRKKGTTIRGIAPDHPSLTEWRNRDSEYGYSMKIVPYETYSAVNSIDVGDTFVRILAFRDLQAVIIENPDVAHTVRQIFEMVWQSLPEKNS